MNEDCIHCGKRSAPNTPCCSTACDLARRLPRGEGNLPATWQLGVVLGWFFLIFNQLLFAGMDLLLRWKQDPENAARFVLASLIVGCAVALANGCLFAIAQPKGMSDWQALGLSGAAAVVLGYRLGNYWGNPLTIGFCVGNLLVGLWLARGLWISGASKTRQKS